MQRRELEHLIRAAGDIADDDEIYVIGSQSILGSYPSAPASLRVSNEADVFPRNRPERWDLIDGSIGEGSPFHKAYGYYAQGVDETTATLPSGWRERLVPLVNENTRGVTGWCLEVHDLALSKLVAEPPKDLRFCEELFRHGLARPTVCRARVSEIPIDEPRRTRLRGLIERLANLGGT